MSPWRVAVLSTLGMLTTAVVVYRITPQRVLPAVPATPSENEVSVADELPVTDEPAVVDELPVADELPLAPQSVTAVPNAPPRVTTRQRTAPAPLLAPPVITTLAPQFVTAAPAPAPPPVPLAVATSSAARAELAAPGLGTLVAVAVGGSCKFSVDGRSITTSSTLRLKLRSGPHVVECGSHTRSVTVKNGETSMALFKL